LLLMGSRVSLASEKIRELKSLRDGARIASERLF